MADGGTPQADVQTALNTASGSVEEDTVRIGAGSYDGPFSYTTAAGGPVRVVGAGADTELTYPSSPASQNVLLLEVAGSTVSDVSISIPENDSNGDLGLVVEDGEASGVEVLGDQTSNATGVKLTGSGVLADSTVTMPLSDDNRGVFAGNSAEIRDGAVTASTGVSYSHAGSTMTISRTRVEASTTALVTDAGTVEVDDSLLDLGSSNNATGICACNFNNATDPIGFDARHMTIVGGGANSRGVWSLASSTAVGEDASVTLDDSVINGPTTAVDVDADNGDTATFSSDHSNYDTLVTNDHGGAGTFEVTQTSKTSHPGSSTRAAGTTGSPRGRR